MRGWVLRLGLLAACLLALVYTIVALGPRRILDAATSADPTWLALSALALVLRYLVWAFKWQVMLRRHGEVSYGTTLRALLAGVFVNLTTPTAKIAGGFVRAALIHRRTRWGLAAAYGWSLADQVTNSMGNIVLGGVLLLAAGATLRPGPDRSALFVLGTIALCGVAAVVACRGWAARQVGRPGAARWLARLTPTRFRVPGPDGPLAGWAQPVFDPVLRIGATARVAPLDLGLAAVSCAFLCVSNACALEAVGVEAPVFQAAAGMVLAGFAGTIVGTVGGIGATELALMGLYGRMEIPSEAGAAAVLLYRGAYYLVSLGLGGAALALEGKPRETGGA